MSAPIPKLAGVCGWPIHHSLSPALHGWWLRKLRLAGAYVPFLVRADEAGRAFRSLPKTSIAGVNVTLPLKRTAWEAADLRTPDAERVGVANCLYMRDGGLVAHNTDVEGFAAPLLARRTAAQLAHTTAVVVGAGGASRAVLGALLGLGVPEIRLTARRNRQARERADAMAVPNLHTLPWESRHEALRGAGLIINATSAGLAGSEPLDLRLGVSSPDALVYDLIYTPRETPLLREARLRGLETLDGLPMLVAQARPAFELFYGVRPPDDLDPLPWLEAHLAPPPSGIA